MRMRGLVSRCDVRIAHLNLRPKTDSYDSRSYVACRSVWRLYAHLNFRQIHCWTPSVRYKRYAGQHIVRQKAFWCRSAASLAPLSSPLGDAASSVTDLRIAAVRMFWFF